MKSVLMVVATEEELHALRRVCPLKSEGVGANFVFRCQGSNYQIDVIRGGIGKAAMAFALGACFARKHYDLVFNIGVAGTVSPRLKAMDIFCATKSCYYDVSLPGLKRGQMDGMPLFFECDPRIVEIARELNPEIRTGIVITGDQFVTKDNLPPHLEDFEDPLAIDMESASVGESTYLTGTPYAILRTISDDATTSPDEAEYENNVEKASNRAATTALQILDKYFSI